MADIKSRKRCLYYYCQEHMHNCALLLLCVLHILSNTLLLIVIIKQKYYDK